MKLTKLQRHTAYIIMLKQAEYKLASGNFSKGLCKLFWDLTEFGCDKGLMIKDTLNELNKKLTTINRKYDDYFVGVIFSESEYGWKERIEILKQCIKETA